MATLSIGAVAEEENYAYPPMAANRIAPIVAATNPSMRRVFAAAGLSHESSGVIESESVSGALVGSCWTFCCGFWRGLGGGAGVAGSCDNKSSTSSNPPSDCSGSVALPGGELKTDSSSCAGWGESGTTTTDWHFGHGSRFPSNDALVTVNRAWHDSHCIENGSTQITLRTVGSNARTVFRETLRGAISRTKKAAVIPCRKWRQPGSFRSAF